MKRASFSASLILCFTSILFWLIPGCILPVAVISLVAGILFLFLFLRFRLRWFREMVFYLICFLLSLLLLWAPVTDYYDTVSSYDGKTVTATVTLTEDPVLSSNGRYRYVVRPEREVFSQKFIFFSPVYYTDAGGSLTATFTFSRLAETYFLGNLSDGIALTASLETAPDKVVAEDGSFSFYALSGRVRRYVHTTLLRYVGGEEAGFMTAALTGDKSSLSEACYHALSETGMLHIVAVSGLHVSVFVSFVLFFLQKIRDLRFRILLSLLSLVIILLFAGFTPSVCRAVIMNAVVFMSQWFSVGSDSLNRLGIAAFIILLFAPYAALSLSFQLSFAAALGIILLAEPFCEAFVQWLFVRCHIICGKVLLSLVSLFAVSLSSFCFTLPLLWFRLNSFSVWSLFLSSVVLPVLEICFFLALVLLLISLFFFLSPFSWILGVMIRYGVTFMIFLTSSAASLMGSAKNLSPMLKWVILGAAVILSLLLFFLPAAKAGSKKKRKQLIRRGLTLLLAVVALLSAYQAADSISSKLAEGEVSPDEGVIQTAFLDVGQGNCFISVLDEEACVVDCGGTKKPGETASDYLTSVGVDTVKFVLISHLHDDHANGLSDLCAEKEILEIIIPYTEGDAALYAEITALAAEEGATLTVLSEDSDRTLGRGVLHLLTKHLSPTSDDQNENSIVALCEYGDYRVLFTGDITTAAEKRLVSSYGNRLNCDILSVPHHGSKGSSCAPFLEAVSPVYSVISVGAKNSYGHPTQAALNRIYATGSQVLRTDEKSTIVIRSDGQKMEVLSADES